MALGTAKEELPDRNAKESKEKTASTDAVFFLVSGLLILTYWLDTI